MAAEAWAAGDQHQGSKPISRQLLRQGAHCSLQAASQASNGWTGWQRLTSSRECGFKGFQTNLSHNLK
jgi:hypothetical protein